MSLTLVGAVLVGAGALTLLVRRQLFLWVLAVSAAFPVTAAVTVGGNSVPPFFVLAVLGLPLLLTRPADGVTSPTPRVVQVLLGFAALSVVVTCLAPTWFAGQPILLPRGGIDVEVISQTPLAHNVSMLAQLLYLVLGVVVVVLVGRRVRPGTRLPDAAFVVGIGLCAARWVCQQRGLAFPDEYFRTYANVFFSQDPIRFAGIYPEPSYLAVFALAAAAYYLVRLRYDGLLGRLVAIAMIGASGLLLYVSTSGIAVLAGVAAAVAMYVAYLLPFLLGRRRINAYAVVALVVPFVLAFTAGTLADRLQRAVSAKAGSVSADHRFASDRFSLHLLTDTFGVGVGLGGNRPSSFVTMLLSCTGVLGALLFLAFAVALLVGAARVPQVHASAWGFAVLLLAKAVGEPSLSAPLMWLLAGVLVAVPARSAVAPAPAPVVRRTDPVGPRHRLAV